MITFSNVSKIFLENVTAVDNISFSINKGEILCLIGSSGCGKTTTLKMINRLIEPSCGEIFINEKSIAKQNPINLRRSIGYVIQRGGLLPHMTVKENISLLEIIKKTHKEKIEKRVNELLEMVGLDPKVFADRPPSKLSGGQQQRVSIARALMSDPPVLLMDEPFGALDPITRNHLHHEFLSLNRKLQKTIVLVTHDLTEAFKLGDEIILMDKGKIVQQGTKKDFLDNPKTDFAKEFVQAHLEGVT